MKRFSIRKRIIVASMACFIVLWAAASAGVIWIQWQSQNRIYAEQVQYLKNFTASLLQQEDYDIKPPEPYSQGKYFLLAIRNKGLIYKYNFEILGISERALIDPMWYASLRGWILYDMPIDEENRLILGVKRDDIYGEVIRITMMIAGIFIIFGLAVLGVILWSVRSSMRPVLALQEDVSARTKDDLGPLDVDRAPDELQALIVAINDLMARISMARNLEKRFLDQAAHELKTPLAGISGQLEVIALDLESKAAQDRLAKIRQMVKRASDLIGQLLDNAQSQFSDDAGDLIALDELLNTEIEKCRDLFPSATIDYAPIESAKAFLVPRLPAQLVMLNLIKNACLYAAELPYVQVGLTERDGRVVCTIADNGLGLSEEAFQLACNPFERLTRASGGGTGLGLTIVCDTINRYGWSIQWQKPQEALGGLCVEVVMTTNE